MNRLLASLTGLLIILYPFLVYWGLARFEPRHLALLLLVMLVLRFFSSSIARPAPPAILLTFTIAGLALVLVAVISNDDQALKLYPVVVNFSLLLIFLFSLRYPPTVIERIAEAIESSLSSSARLYTRQVTKLWCGFFLVNGVISVLTSVFASMAVWALYNGLVAYLLMGLLFACEYMYRTLVVKKRDL